MTFHWIVRFYVNKLSLLWFCQHPIGFPETKIDPLLIVTIISSALEESVQNFILNYFWCNVIIFGFLA